MKKCPYCAEEIQDEAIVCRYCGRDIPQKTDLAKNNIVAPQKRYKKPWLAALLNCFPFIFGLGYLYIGKVKRFVIVFLLQLLTLMPMTWLGLRNYNQYLLAIIWIISIIDVYNQTNRLKSFVKTTLG
jgi:hypothetical protein